MTHFFLSSEASFEIYSASFWLRCLDVSDMCISIPTSKSMQFMQLELITGNKFVIACALKVKIETQCLPICFIFE